MRKILQTSDDSQKKIRMSDFRRNFLCASKFSNRQSPDKASAASAGAHRFRVLRGNALLQNLLQARIIGQLGV